MVIGERLLELRKDAGLTQDDLAAILRVNKHSVSSYERNKSEPPDDVKVAIARYFNVSVDYLLGLTDNPAPIEKRAPVIRLPAEFAPQMRSEVESYIDYLIYKSSESIQGNKGCFFIGHSDASESLLPLLSESIERHITQFGVTEFYVGHYGNFDALARRALSRAKKEHPQITRMLVTPYHPAVRQVERPKDIDELFYPFEISVPAQYAITRANRQMIESCEFLISYVHRPGRARNLFEYALRREKRGLIRIENLKEQREGNE